MSFCRMLRDASFKYDVLSHGVRQIEFIAIGGPGVSGCRISPEVPNDEVMSVFHGEESHIRTGHLQQVPFPHRPLQQWKYISESEPRKEAYFRGSSVGEARETSGKCWHFTGLIEQP